MSRTFLYTLAAFIVLFALSFLGLGLAIFTGRRKTLPTCATGHGDGDECSCGRKPDEPCCEQHKTKDRAT